MSLLDTEAQARDLGLGLLQCRRRLIRWWRSFNIMGKNPPRGTTRA